MTPTALTVSLGIFAHNEETNIISLLQSIAKQQTEVAQIQEILVLSSGSSDRTNQLVRQAAKKESRIQLVEQLKRQGKSSAVNLFLKKSKSNIVIVISGDLRLHSRAIEEMTLPFVHKKVGMVGAHPVPTNTVGNPLGPEIKLLWHLHHLISLQDPKCGEMIAFRRVIRSLPKGIAMDEATIEVLLKMVGYKVVYAPRAIVYNKGPKSIKDFITQRRRNFTGHLALQRRYHYQVSTNKPTNLRQAILGYLLDHPQAWIPMTKLISLEIVSRLLGWIDFYVLGRNPHIWKMIER